jgi:periplasmic protein TonB
VLDVTPQPRRRLGGALTSSIAVHLLVLAALVWVRYSSPRSESEIAHVDPLDERIVWIASPGPRGGGGGGRTLSPPPPEPAPPLATRTEDAVAPLPVPVEEPQPAPEPIEPQPAAPALIAEAANPGAAVTPATAGDGRDPGPGSGPGDGAGVGPGKDGGSGGGPFQPGNGVTSPIPIQRGTPNYTDDAVRNRAQGVIVVACVVEPNGECGDVSVVRTFKPPYGLDQQALAAARRWRFRPGMRDGKPVPVLVNLEIAFRIH